MVRLADIQARVDSIAQLQEVVAAMRSLAAVRMQQAAEMLPAVRRYAEIVAGGLSQALSLSGSGRQDRRAGEGRNAVLLFAAEHGFVGGYGEALAEAAGKPSDLFLIGSRGAVLLEEEGRRPTWWMPMTSHAGGINDLARAIAAELYRRFAAGAFTRLEVVFGRLEEGGRWRIQRDVLLPPDLSRFRRPPSQVAPLHHLPPATLTELLVEEYFLADLARAATEALAAENAARLQAMSTAYDNIEHKLEELRGQERILRQEQITDELLDVLNGAEAATRN